VESVTATSASLFPDDSKWRLVRVRTKQMIKSEKSNSRAALRSISNEVECSTMDQDVVNMWKDKTAGEVADSKKETWDESSEELEEDSELTDLDSDS
jgi:ATP:corrinoid adenosyltransferase